MIDENENIPGRHRFGATGKPLVPNWALIVVTLICLGFWAWVAYNVARWVP